MKKSIVLLFAGFLFCFFSCNSTVIEPIVICIDSGNSVSSDDNAIVLDGEKTFEEQLTLSDKTYIIFDGFDLNGQEVSVPKNSTLNFIGGSIYNGTLNFNNTTIQGYASFNSCQYKGSLANDEVKLEWFNIESGKTAKVQVSIKNYDTVNTHNVTMLQQIFDCCKNDAIMIVDKVYFIEAPINVTKKITVKGYDLAEGTYANFLQNVQYGFYTTMSKTIFEVASGGDISLQGISVVGYMSLYIANNLWEKCYSNGNVLTKPYCLCGIHLNEGAKIGYIRDSSLVAFTYGVKSDGGIIGPVENSYFSANRFGFWAKDTNDIKCTGCRFNTNLINFHFFEKNLNYTKDYKEPLKETDADQIVKMGGGVYFGNCKNVLIKDCRFEFNFIHAIVDEAAEDVTFDNCIFDTGTLAQFVINNQESPDRTHRTSPVYSPTNPAINNLTIKAGTFARGARCDILGEQSVSGFAIFYICDKGNRGSIINIQNNIVSDNMEIDKKIDVVYETNVFDIYNTSTEGTHLNLVGNSFNNTDAITMFNGVDGSTGTFNIYYKGDDFGNTGLAGGKNLVLQPAGVNKVINLSEGEL